MVPRFLSSHPHLDWPEAESDALQEELQQVGAAGQNVKVYVEVFVEVYAHAIKIFVVSWSDFVPQLAAMVRSMMRIHSCRDPHLELLQALR